MDAEIRKQHEHQGTTEDHVTKVSPEIDLRIIHADVLEFRFKPQQVGHKHRDEKHRGVA